LADWKEVIYYIPIHAGTAEPQGVHRQRRWLTGCESPWESLRGQIWLGGERFRVLRGYSPGTRSSIDPHIAGYQIKQ